MQAPPPLRWGRGKEKEEGKMKEDECRASLTSASEVVAVAVTVAAEEKVQSKLLKLLTV